MSVCGDVPAQELCKKRGTSALPQPSIDAFQWERRKH
ncbi:hypothetical protein EGR_10976 [Echinococcus granulosus]|uniref:Uncharacterized protein n=1 Tax=Echinococcus granulosus TaxID=6210 RepID=W6U119_ECHGR|nr:hypothetical protein EGR_10976 [Echinococcus granulosus]EUB54166.1 hypothetical protein EGR_10976 [Echinococcus granulosus]